ncbi:NAD(P)-dependent oxidoreductase [Microbacterium sp. ISL-59]|uniref:NAD-dependent epimerase/dehydratase family protein n=1 Tax=Microbacterium sp. ISL-59 TaxID=2819159 RepID=UPI001BEC70BC|nr:NAD(P)-dependent oxidoreductase [Microbacterium sp. ISL-59]MBT2496733.1 NAD(P)-dependent oxidoreductase [Microbacterium sp. ISL-59]
MRIVMIGGAGHVGRLIGPAVAGLGEVVVADRAGVPPVAWASTVDVDVQDADSLRVALRDADVVVYLAMGTKDGWGGLSWAQSQFEVNVLGLHTALEVAVECGVAHVVIAGSMSVFADFRNAAAGDLPDAVDAYGLSKRLGEEVARAVAVRHGVDVTVLRLVLPMGDEIWAADANHEHADVMTSGTDTAAAFVAAVRRRPSGFRTFAISGDRTSEQVDVSEALAGLGWAPTAVRQTAMS